MPSFTAVAVNSCPSPYQSVLTDLAEVLAGEAEALGTCAKTAVAFGSSWSAFGLCNGEHPLSANTITAIIETAATTNFVAIAWFSGLA